GGYFTAGAPLAGTPYGVTASGYRPAGADFSDADAYVLTNADGTNRFPARAATDGIGAMTQAEVTAVLEEAFKVLKRERAAIRQPEGSRSQVTISVVDRDGAVLGIVRSPDAPIFGTDVSLQKARTAAFFSSATAAGTLSAQPGFASYVTAAQAFFANSSIFTGVHAFGDRSIGSIARPYFPDGQPGTTNGPFSVPIAKFNPFATGLQSALIIGNLATELTAPATQPATCTFTPRLGNGIQIFPGSVPIYRGSTLVGGIGVSGDGVTQDDMVGYLGLNNAGARLGAASGIANAPPAIRSNLLSPPAAGGAFLQYVICPQAPFVDSNEQNPCPNVPHQ
ncbi:MAG: heme-binding protein, partial [Sphingobium sp.]